MLIRRSPQSLESNSSGKRVHAHGPTDGIYERRIVWPLASSDEVRAQVGHAALEGVLQRRGMNGHTPELVRRLGNITADLGRVEYEDAETLAEEGLDALEREEDALRQRIIAGDVEVSVGVGLSAAVVTFPDKQERPSV